MKHSDQLMVKITPNINKSLGHIKYFNTTLKEYKVYTLMEHQIASQKMTLMVFRSFVVRF